MTADELRATNEYVTYCEIVQPQTSTTYNQATNIITANCGPASCSPGGPPTAGGASCGLVFYTMDDIINAYPDPGTRMTVGQTVRTPVIAVYPDASSIPTTAYSHPPAPTARHRTRSVTAQDPRLLSSGTASISRHALTLHVAHLRIRRSRASGPHALSRSFSLSLSRWRTGPR
jgi:hypothetical protein